MDPNYYNSQPNNFNGMPGSNGPSFPYANKAINEVKGYYDPYTSNANDPEGIVARIMGNFNQSPGQIKSNQERLNAADNTAAAQGRSLSPMHMRDQGDLASALYSEQMQQYIKNVLDQQNLGLNASTSAAGDIGNLYNSAGTAAHQDELQKQSDKNSLISAIMQAIGTMGGAAIGGPAGAAAGGAAGTGLSKFFSKQPEQNDMRGYGFNNPNYSNTEWMGY
jgi:hypothetical protein